MTMTTRSGCMLVAGRRDHGRVAEERTEGQQDEWTRVCELNRPLTEKGPSSLETINSAVSRKLRANNNECGELRKPVLLITTTVFYSLYTPIRNFSPGKIKLLSQRNSSCSQVGFPGTLNTNVNVGLSKNFVWMTFWSCCGIFNVRTPAVPPSRLKD